MYSCFHPFATTVQGWFSKLSPLAQYLWSWTSGGPEISFIKRLGIKFLLRMKTTSWHRSKGFSRNLPTTVIFSSDCGEMEWLMCENPLPGRRRQSQLLESCIGRCGGARNQTFRLRRCCTWSVRAQLKRFARPPSPEIDQGP